MRELLRREWRVISSSNPQPLPLRVAKWVAFLGIARRLYGTRWFRVWIFGLPLAGLGTHLLYRYKTQGWRQPWGGWKDVEVMDIADSPEREDK